MLVVRVTFNINVLDSISESICVLIDLKKKKSKKKKKKAMMLILFEKWSCRTTSQRSECEVQATTRSEIPSNEF